MKSLSSSANIFTILWRALQLLLLIQKGRAQKLELYSCDYLNQEYVYSQDQLNALKLCNGSQQEICSQADLSTPFWKGRCQAKIFQQSPIKSLYFGLVNSNEQGACSKPKQINCYFSSYSTSFPIAQQLQLFQNASQNAFCTTTCGPNGFVIATSQVQQVFQQSYEFLTNQSSSLNVLQYSSTDYYVACNKNDVGFYSCKPTTPNSQNVIIDANMLHSLQLKCKGPQIDEACFDYTTLTQVSALSQGLCEYKCMDRRIYEQQYQIDSSNYVQCNTGLLHYVACYYKGQAVTLQSQKGSCAVTSCAPPSQNNGWCGNMCFQNVQSSRPLLSNDIDDQATQNSSNCCQTLKLGLSYPQTSLFEEALIPKGLTNQIQFSTNDPSSMPVYDTNLANGVLQPNTASTDIGGIPIEELQVVPFPQQDNASPISQIWSGPGPAIAPGKVDYHHNDSLYPLNMPLIKQNINFSDYGQTPEDQSTPLSQVPLNSPLQLKVLDQQTQAQCLCKDTNETQFGCNLSKVELPFTWSNYSIWIGPWRVCSATCGGGIQERSVICIDKYSKLPVSSLHCQDKLNDYSFNVTCNPQPCPSKQFWQLANFSDCIDPNTGLGAACGGGLRLRTASCVEKLDEIKGQYQVLGNCIGAQDCQNLAKFLPSGCQQVPKEYFQVECNTSPCSSQIFSHTVGPWSQCIGNCLQKPSIGIQNRTVKCVNIYNEEVDQKLCVVQAPNSTQSCNIQCLTTSKNLYTESNKSKKVEKDVQGQTWNKSVVQETIAKVPWGGDCLNSSSYQGNTNPSQSSSSSNSSSNTNHASTWKRKFLQGNQNMIQSHVTLGPFIVSNIVYEVYKSISCVREIFQGLTYNAKVKQNVVIQKIRALKQSSGGIYTYARDANNVVCPSGNVDPCGQCGGQCRTFTIGGLPCNNELDSLGSCCESGDITDGVCRGGFQKAATQKLDASASGVCTLSKLQSKDCPQILRCPIGATQSSQAPSLCAGHGRCIYLSGRCDCFVGYQGDTCTQCAPNFQFNSMYGICEPQNKQGNVTYTQSQHGFSMLNNANTQKQARGLTIGIAVAAGIFLFACLCFFGFMLITLRRRKIQKYTQIQSQRKKQYVKQPLSRSLKESFRTYSYAWREFQNQLAAPYSLDQMQYRSEQEWQHEKPSNSRLTDTKSMPNQSSQYTGQSVQGLLQSYASNDNVTRKQLS